VPVLLRVEKSQNVVRIRAGQLWKSRVGTCVRVPALTQHLDLLLNLVVGSQMLTAHRVSAVGVGSMTCLSVHRPAEPAERLDAMEAEMSQGGLVPVVASRIANNKKDRRQDLAHFALRVRQESGEFRQLSERHGNSRVGRRGFGACFYEVLP
jgi:hypothetical protein